MVKIEIENAILTIAVDRPDKCGTAIWTGQATELADWLQYQIGTFGHVVGDNPCPIDAISALKMSGKKYRVVAGQEILDLPLMPLPDGAVS